MPLLAHIQIYDQITNHTHRAHMFDGTRSEGRYNPTGLIVIELIVVMGLDIIY